MTADPQGRRVHPRYTAPYRVVVSAAEARQLAALTDDLSASGLFLSTPHDLPLDVPLDLTLHLPDGQRAIRCLGRIVRRANPEREGRVGYGVLLEFGEPAEAIAYVNRINALRDGEVDIAPADFHVLLVADNEVVRELVTSSLPYFWERRYPHGPAIQVEAHAHGDEAEAALAPERHRLVICEIRLPSLEGRDWVVAIRADEKTVSLPIIVVGEPELAARLEALDADAFLPKPIRLKELYPAVHMLLAGRVPERATPSSGDASPLERVLRDLID